MSKLLSTKEVCLLLGISLSTFYRYCKSGLLKPDLLTFGGHRRFKSSQFIKENKADDRKILIYSRVSSQDQKKDLQRQRDKLFQYVKQKYKENPIEINDLGSGLNYKKKGLLTLLNLIVNKKIKMIVINHKDRLLRFGSEIIFFFCNFFNIKIDIVEKSSSQNFEIELSKD